MVCDDCFETDECRCGPGEMCGSCFESKVKPEDVSKLLKLVKEPEEPPLTPEEEEQAPEDEQCLCGQSRAQCDASEECPCPPGCSCCKVQPKEPLPPQPERRPPYAVAYSVSGHLFEVALPGDATVRAVDGALVIQHHLGPVAGIVSVLPVINKES